jgi:hypothetical protein
MSLRVVDLGDADIIIRNPGSLQPGQQWPATSQAVIGDALWLVDHQLSFDGDRLTVATRWFTARELTDDHQLWFQVRDGAGGVIAEWRDYALAGMSPPRLWRPVDLVEDHAGISLPQRASHDVTVWLALVNTNDASLLPVTEATDIVVERGWLRLPIRSE